MEEMSKFETISAKIDRLLHHKTMLADRDEVITNQATEIHDLRGGVMTALGDAAPNSDNYDIEGIIAGVASLRHQRDDLQAEKDLIYEKLADVELEDAPADPAPASDGE